MLYAYENNERVSSVFSKEYEDTVFLSHELMGCNICCITSSLIVIDIIQCKLIERNVRDPI